MIHADNTRKCEQYKKTRTMPVGKGSVSTVLLHLSLLPSGADQDLNPGRSTTIAKDEEEKTLSL